MIFKVNKREFLDALSMTQKGVSNTTPLPILNGIKLIAENNTLTLISSDTNISIKTIIKNNDEKEIITISEEGENVIESKYLLDIVRKIDSDFVNVEIFDNSLAKIYGGKSEIKINAMTTDDYPAIDFSCNNALFKFDTYTFFKIVNETSFACSEKDTRPILTGVNFKAENGKLYVNATDSYRLASKTVDIDSNLSFNITIPRKYLLDIYHSLSNVEEMEIGIDNTKISFIFNNSIIQTRLLDDEFPDVKRLIPTSFTQSLVVSAKELSSAIDRSSFIKSDGKNIVKLTINNKNIDVTSNGNNGSSFEEINVISFEGSPIEVSCSGKYLIDAIKAMSADEITISFSGELKPLIITDSNDSSLIQLISPVRTYK